MNEIGISIGDVDFAIAAAADRLQAAAERGVALAPVRDLIGRDDLAAAYAVQSRVTDARLARGERIVGRKVGLTSPAVQEQMGIDQPDFGVLFATTAYESGADVPAGSILQPRAEAEVAFVLREDLAGGTIDASLVRNAIDYAVAAIEICGSRIEGWDITVADTVADNASAGAFVLGRRRLRIDEFDTREVTMSMSVDGVEVSTGTGAACLGDPINAVVWLARTAVDVGDPLRAGQVILSGALGPMRPIEAGSNVRAVVEPLGSVEFTLSEVSA